MIMTLDEAIEHCLENVRRNRDIASCKSMLEKYGGENLCNSCIKCAEEHEQLAEWLKELKELREFKATYQKGMDYSYATFMYNKAIDDFAEKISTYGTYDNYGNVVDILEIAEKIKKEVQNNGNLGNKKR